MKTVIEMAREAGFLMENSAAIQAAERFAELVRADEREQCLHAAEVAASLLNDPIAAIKQARSAPVQEPAIKQGWDVDTLLDKKAENARELGLDYKPAEVLGHNGWGFPIKAAAPVREDWGLDYEPVGEAYLCDKCQTPFDGAWECPNCGHRSATKEPVYTTPPAAPVQEPYGQVTVVKRPGCVDQHWFYRWPEPPYLDNAAECHTLYTTPPAAQRQWVGLTDAEILEVLCIWPDADDDPDDYMEDIREVRAIETKLKEKNT